MDNEMIERVRKFSIEAWKNKRPNQIDVINAMVLDQEFFIAIIKAMREPTEKMLKAGAIVLDGEIEETWQAMIDAVLND